MPAQNTRTASFSIAVSPQNTRSVPPANNHPKLAWETTNPHSTEQGAQHANSQAENIMSQIYAECTRLLIMNHELLATNRKMRKMRKMLRIGKDEQTGLKA